MKRISMLVMFVFSLFTPSLAVGQNLPVGDPRNEAFIAQFQEIVRINPQIQNFNAMPSGTAYNLPDGRDVLRNGSTRGIWGQEFEKTYGVPYAQFLATGQVPPAPEEVSTIEYAQPMLASNPWWATTPWWAWMLFIATVITAVVLFTRLRERSRYDEILERERQSAEEERFLARDAMDSERQVRDDYASALLREAEAHQRVAEILETLLMRQQEREIDMAFRSAFGAESGSLGADGGRGSTVVNIDCGDHCRIAVGEVVPGEISPPFIIRQNSGMNGNRSSTEELDLQPA